MRQQSRRFARVRMIAAAIGMALLAVLVLAACGDDSPLAEGTATGVDGEPELGSEPAGSGSDGSGLEAVNDTGDPADTEIQAAGSGSDTAGQEGTAPSLEGPGEIGDDGTVRGELTAAGDTHAYRLPATTGQELVLIQLGGCRFSGGDLLQVEIAGGGIEDRWLFRSEADGGCSDIRRVEITETGTVTLTVGGAPGQEDTTGTYAFRVSDVTTPPAVPIDGNLTVSPGRPTPSAGQLERIGHRDRYLFTAAAGETYVLRQLGCDLVDGDFIVMEVDGAGISDSLLFSGPTGCDAVERLTPTESGPVELLVRANGDETIGTYSFVVEGRGSDPSSPDIVLGDAADPEASPIVSGELSAIGEQDRYSFDVTAGQQFVVQQTGDCEIVGADELWADVNGPGFDDTVRFKTLLDGDCRSNSWYEAEADGPVEIVVRHRDDAATGTYNFRVLDVPIEPIETLTSGQVVAPGSPTEGAGVLSAIGQRDVFRIDVVDDQIVTIELLGGCDFAGNDRIFLDAEGAGLNELLFMDEASEGDCLRSESHEVESTGPLFITVSDRNDNLATGTYSFVVTVEEQ